MAHPVDEEDNHLTVADITAGIECRKRADHFTAHSVARGPRRRSRTQESLLRAMQSIVKDLNPVAHPTDNEFDPRSVEDFTTRIAASGIKEFTTRSLAGALIALEKLRHGLLFDNDKDWNGVAEELPHAEL